jgi:putative serine protease PepD
MNSEANRYGSLPGHDNVERVEVGSKFPEPGDAQPDSWTLTPPGSHKGMPSGMAAATDEPSAASMSLEGSVDPGAAPLDPTAQWRGRLSGELPPIQQGTPPSPYWIRPETSGTGAEPPSFEGVAPGGTPGQRRSFSFATVVVSVVLSLVAGGLGGAAAGSLAVKERPPARVELPQSTGIALPQNASIADLVRAIEPGVAAIHTFVGLQMGAGTGFLVDPNGHIITNKHVVEGGKEYRVNIAGKKDLRAQLVGSDPELDIAVLKIDPPESAKPLPLGNSDSLRVGDTVIAIGNALDLPGGPTVTMGIISALDRSLTDRTPSGQRIALTGLIQTDAAINPGNSGGPLINLAGQVVGVNTAVAANPNDITGSQAAQNIGFAININDAKSAAENIINGTVSKRGILGVDIATVTPIVAARRGLAVDHGALVMNVMEGGPADKAGIRPEDVIVGIDGKEVRTAEELRAQLRSKKPGDTVKVEVFRGSASMTFEATLAEAP